MRILSMGEMMVELSGAGPGLWRSGFAGDTFNTACYLAALRPGWSVAYGTRLGHDPLSEEALGAIAAAGLATGWVTRDPERAIGLYMIALAKGERSFSYWRSASAARLMAEDPAWLAAAIGWADVVYLSGITLAILSPAARARLLAALSGARVVFDPNIRPRLWESPEVLRATLTAAAGLSEICLPSFDDEAAAFGDATPEATARRYAEAGAREVIVKNGAGPLAFLADGVCHTAPAPAPVVPVDTTGAGDSFNAGFLAARLAGAPPGAAIARGQALAALVVQHPGALVPRPVLDAFLHASARQEPIR